jgi:putative peptidoglycan lipid II flippase
MGIYSAGIGVVIGAFIHMIIQLPLVFKLGFRYRPSFDLSIPGVKNFLKLSPPRTLALAISELRKLFLGFFATSLGNLSFLVMDYGLTLMAIPIRFFGVAIGQAALPFLSDEAGDDGQVKFKKLLLNSLHQVSFLTMPASALLLILRIPIVRLVYGTANFPWTTTITVGRVLAILALSIFAQALTHLLIRSFYALKDTKTPLYVTLIDGVSYLITCFLMIFVFHLGVLGIATATTITGFFEFLILLILLNRKLKGIAGYEFWIPQLKILVATFFMTVFLYLPFKFLDELVFDTSRTLELIGLTITTSSIALLVYLYFAVLLQIKELYVFVELINKFGGWKKSISKSEEFFDNSVENKEV